jgi:hypothetical protein
LGLSLFSISNSFSLFLYGFPNQSASVAEFSSSKSSSGLTPETDTGYTSHLIGVAIPDPAGAVNSSIDSQCVHRAGFIQARARWISGQALYVFQVSDHVC